MQQALEGDVLPLSAHLPGAPEAVEALIGWILQKDPKSRPPCGAALVAEVEAVLDAPHDAARVARARAAHDRRRRRQTRSPCACTPPRSASACSSWAR